MSMVYLRLSIITKWKNNVAEKNVKMQIRLCADFAVKPILIMHYCLLI